LALKEKKRHRCAADRPAKQKDARLGVRPKKTGASGKDDPLRSERNPKGWAFKTQGGKGTTRDGLFRGGGRDRNSKGPKLNARSLLEAKGARKGLAENRRIIGSSRQSTLSRKGLTGPPSGQCGGAIHPVRAQTERGGAEGKTNQVGERDQKSKVPNQLISPSHKTKEGEF